MSLIKAAVSALALLAASATFAEARDQLQITGSSTVLPYATIVAEAFGEQGTFKTPVVEGGGSGAGRKKLCEGVGDATVDIANSSSKITKGDIETCTKNGVTQIMEVRIGDIDRGIAQAFAQLLAASARPAAFDNRGLEGALLAERFGNDGGIGQHGRGTGDLQLVAGLGEGRRYGEQRQRRDGGFGQGHESLLGNLDWGFPPSGLLLGPQIKGFVTVL